MLARFFEQDLVDDGLVADTSFPSLFPRPGYYFGVQPNGCGQVFVHCRFGRPAAGRTRDTAFFLNRFARGGQFPVGEPSRLLKGKLF